MRNEGLLKMKFKTLWIASALGAAASMSAYAGTLPDGTIVCNSRIEMKKVIIAAMDMDQEEVARLSGPGSACVPITGDRTFELVTEEPNASLVRIDLDDEQTVDLWAPTWLVSRDP
jgi:hypothetical protein